MIRRCTRDDVATICAIVNDAAQAYKGVIPDDCWREPYMPLAELEHEIAQGVEFWACEAEGALLGVMGIQDRDEVDLIRHAYVRTHCRRRGIGSELLSHLQKTTARPVLIGTWADAHWAIRFYLKHRYRLLDRDETTRLLRTYWTIPQRQIATSVVLASPGFVAPSPRPHGG